LITLENVSKRYGAQVALAVTTLTLEAGTTTVVLGASGCGKSTLLRLIVGLITPDSGVVRIKGEILNRENANRLRHDIGYVIQDGGLFPHLSAQDNVTLLARHLRRPERWIADRTAELAALVQLPRSSEPIGKRLDFLLQEIHREFNTIASKSADLEVTNATLEARSEIEKLKEQTQNIE